MIAAMFPIRLLHGPRASATQHPGLGKPDGVLEV
jgi:hypothetical protein